MNPSLDLELVNTFLAVVDAKGFKAAAGRLNKTPAAVSMQIKRLEEVLGQRVLERSNQGIELTRAGLVLFEMGQRLMALNHELIGEIQEDDIAGELDFGAPADYATALLGQLLPIFQSELPQVRPRILLDLSRMLRHKIAAGKLDMAIVAREPETDEGSELWREEIAWFGRAKTPDGRPRVGLLAADCTLRDRALADLERSDGDHAVVLHSPTVTALRDAVASGFCQALLPVSTAQGLERAASGESHPAATLSFCLIAGPRFCSPDIERVAIRFRGALAG